ncbi:MAG: hypothetical protein KGI97_02510 [Alphaproteobacteria bacterium]|nr:hypothetical protein [Alphaproteobacteria bacterium]
MRISFIGMSNIGKSFWSNRLAAQTGCPHIECDALIAEKLAPELQGCKSVRDLAAWMGQPFEPRHKETSARYLTHEREALQEILNGSASMDSIIDTTGSVIYLDAETLDALRNRSLVVYLEASHAHVDALFRSYAAHPKPLIWGNAYAPHEGETHDAALHRCFPGLLNERAARYKQLAHITLPYEAHKNHRADMAALIEQARQTIE